MEVGEEIVIQRLFQGIMEFCSALNMESAYVKGEIAYAKIGTLGFEGDEHSSSHGGPDRAINHFSTSTYSILKETFPEHESTLIPGGFAENISTDGDMLNETNVCIGDIFSVGDVLLEVAQPRKPCPKVNKFHSASKLTRFCLVNGYSGWFYRVLQPGNVRVGDKLKLVERKYPNVTIQRVQRACFGNKAQQQEEFKDLNGHIQFLEKLVALKELAPVPWLKQSKNLLEKFQSEENSNV